MIQINHWNGTLLYEVQADNIKDALESLVASDAYLSGADLRGANLRGADLGGANLSGADLGGANLRGADLGDADLGDANLSGAYLSGADLRGANLGDADLSDANLGVANLRGADLGGAYLSGADLSGANLRGAYLGGADLSGADLSEHYRVPELHNKILAAIETGGRLEMSSWHTCETTHCRAGWAIHLAGPVGAVLEDCLGPSVAGALITMASCPWLEKVPDFNASNEAALADIRECAKRELEEVSK